MKIFFLGLVAICIVGILAVNRSSIPVLSDYLQVSELRSLEEISSYLNEKKGDLLVEKDQLEGKIEELKTELDEKKDMGVQKFQEITAALESAQAAFRSVKESIEELENSFEKTKEAFSLEG